MILPNFATSIEKEWKSFCFGNNHWPVRDTSVSFLTCGVIFFLGAPSAYFWFTGTTFRPYFTDMHCLVVGDSRVDQA